MADIRAFRGFRYDLGQVGALSDVICPPYDVIDSALQQHLYESSPFNAVSVIASGSMMRRWSTPPDTDMSVKSAVIVIFGLPVCCRCSSSRARRGDPIIDHLR